MNATVTGKDRAGIARSLSGTSSGRDVLQLVRDRVFGMDAFEPGHAGSTITAELQGKIAASRKAEQERLAAQERLRQAQAIAAEEIKRVRRQFREKQRQFAEKAAREAELAATGYAGLFGG